MESDDDDEQILFERRETKEPRCSQDVPQERPKGKLPEVSSHFGKHFEGKKAPKMTEHSVPTLHSGNYKYKGPSLKEKVLLTVMDANINKLKEGDENLPELCKK